MDIVEFLTARLDEREHLARAVEHAVGDQYDALTAAMGTTYGLSMVSLYWRSHDPARVLADVAAKRRMLEATIEMRASDSRGLAYSADLIERNLAAPDFEHPDYNPAWAVG